MSELVMDDAVTAQTVASSGSESGRYLTFALAGETFALDILDVTEIIDLRPMTEVPMMPAFVRGVINLRGRVVPVVDMAARFGRGATEVTRRSSIIIVEAADAAAQGEGGHRDLGVMVDAVHKVVHVEAADIEPAPAFGTGLRSDFIKGIAKHNGEFIIVLDLRHVLSMDEMVGLSEVAARVAQLRETQPTVSPESPESPESTEQGDL